MQSRGRFVVLELLMQVLSIAALVLMLALFGVQFSMAASRISKRQAERHVAEQPCRPSDAPADSVRARPCAPEALAGFPTVAPVQR